MGRDPEVGAEQSGDRDVPSDSRRAPFIAFEGVEGCGKSTQIGRLSSLLTAANRPFLVTREPGGTPLGEAVRAALLSHASSGMDGLTELFLLAASRRAHVRGVILPALERGILVISDRFADSSVAYQGGGRGLAIEVVERVNELATDGLRPDLTLLLDLVPEVGAERVSRRGQVEDRLEKEALAFHQRVRQAYLELARRRGPTYRVIDASAPVEEVAARILEALRPLLGDASGV